MRNMKRIWFNHWFSTAYNIIKMIRADNLSFQFIGTNENERSLIATVCDEWYTEPRLKGDEYVAYCIDFCLTHQIDAFLPRRGAARHQQAEAGFWRHRRQSNGRWLRDCLHSQPQGWGLCATEGQGVSTIPEHIIVTTAQEFLAAYENIQSRYREVCFKFVHDEGGKSFRLIDNNRRGFTALFKKQNTRITLQTALDALGEREQFPQSWSCRTSLEMR